MSETGYARPRPALTHTSSATLGEISPNTSKAGSGDGQVDADKPSGSAEGPVERRPEQAPTRRRLRC